MKLEKQLLELSEKIKKNKDIIQSEEHTKMSFIAPFIQLLGYDMFNPTEVVPEYTCDFGVKKGEKVDYCIMVENAPYMLIECKDCRNVLTSDNISQLYRYYSVSSAKIALLTNGVIYMLFTDSAEKNKMDSEPFYTFSMLNLKQEDYSIINMLLKENIVDFSKGSYSSLIARVQLFKTEVDKWWLSEKNSISRNFINYVKKEINTYNLPNEEIAKVLQEKLFIRAADKNIASDLKDASVHNIKGNTGIFYLDADDLSDKITGSVLVYVSIEDTEYLKVSAIKHLLYCLIDYAFDKLGMSASDIIKIDDSSFDYFIKAKEDDTNSYRGISFKHGISGKQIIDYMKKYCDLLNINQHVVKLGLLSRPEYYELKNKGVQKEQYVDHIKQLYKQI